MRVHSNPADCHCVLVVIVIISPAAGATVIDGHLPQGELLLEGSSLARVGRPAQAREFRERPGHGNTRGGRFLAGHLLLSLLQRGLGDGAGDELW